MEDIPTESIEQQAHIYISNVRVYFKKVNGDYIAGKSVPNPISEEEIKNVLRLKQVMIF